MSDYKKAAESIESWAAEDLAIEKERDSLRAELEQAKETIAGLYADLTGQEHRLGSKIEMLESRLAIAVEALEQVRRYSDNEEVELHCKVSMEKIRSLG